MFPSEPDVPAEQRAETSSRLRYEDVAQDGRLTLAALPPFLGKVVWAMVGTRSETHDIMSSGVIPILTKLVLEGEGGPVAIAPPVTASGCFQLAHSVVDGEVDKLFLNMWVQVRAPRGRTYGPPPPGAGELIPVGRVFAEHVFTRLFAPPEARRVRRFEHPSVPPVPPARHDFVPAEALLALPAGATWLDEMTADDAPVVFGLMHTDSNQHVNSLVYPRLFEEAALRRFARLGEDVRVLARRVAVAYRKPCFAGDRVRLLLRACRGADGRLGAAGTFAAEDGRPHATLVIWFEP